MENFQGYIEYLKPELLLLIPVLYFCGIAIRTTEGIADKMIPMILGICGVLLALIWVLGTSEIVGIKDILLSVFTAITQGILCAGMSVYVNQLIVQAKK